MFGYDSGKEMIREIDSIKTQITRIHPNGGSFKT